MKNKNLHLLYTFILIVITGFTPIPIKREQSKEWKLEKTGEGINIYTRVYEGSDLKEFKAITVVNADSELLEKILENIEDYPKWQANVSTAKIITQVSKTEFYIYYTFDLPWPISDRDIVVNFKKVVGVDGKISYLLTSKPEYIKEKEGFVRIKNSFGKWQLSPQGKNKIEVLHQFYGDPAGSLPNSVINMFIVDGPYTTLVNLKNKVGK